jgi:SAM-dependent methyltransferase
MESTVIGDDYSLDEMRQWYLDEKEAFAKLTTESKDYEIYRCHAVNTFYGFKFLPKGIHFNNVIGFGSAKGDEFLPIIGSIGNLFILEPSDQLIVSKIGNILPKYIKPAMDGHLDFATESIDLITCFDVLHHVPNPSYVLSEMYRILKHGGYLLLKEPIHKMGDKTREGLTSRERGLPLEYLRNKLAKFEIIKESPHFVATSFLFRKTGKYLYQHKVYLWVDRLLSKVFLWNLHFDAKNALQRVAPSNVFFVLQKK